MRDRVSRLKGAPASRESISTLALHAGDRAEFHGRRVAGVTANWAPPGTLNTDIASFTLHSRVATGTGNSSSEYQTRENE